MNLLGTGFIFVYGVAFGVVAWAPWIEPFEGLTKESAQVVEVRHNGTQSTVTKMITSSGREVRCMHTKTGGCSTNEMQLLREQKATVLVWHDGESVLQLATEHRVILPYERAHQGRWFSAFVSSIFLLIACIKIAIHFRVICTAHRPNPSLQGTLRDEAAHRP